MLDVTLRSANPPALVPPDTPPVQLAQDAFEATVGRRPLLVRSGGSIPLVTFLKQAVPQAEILIWGAEDDAAAIHSANERVDLKELEQVSLAEALFFEQLTRTP